MGDRLTENQTSTPYGDIFDNVLPDFLAMGMSYDDYWDGEVGMKTAVKKAYLLKREYERKMMDRQNWYIGQYIMAALNATPLLVAGLNVKRGTNLPEYPNRPFLERIEEEKRDEDRKKKEEDQTKLAMAMFQAGIERLNRNIQKRQEPAKESESGQ